MGRKSGESKLVLYQPALWIETFAFGYCFLVSCHWFSAVCPSAAAAHKATILSCTALLQSVGIRCCFATGGPALASALGQCLTGLVNDCVSSVRDYTQTTV